MKHPRSIPLVASGLVLVALLALWAIGACHHAEPRSTTDSSTSGAEGTAVDSAPSPSSSDLARSTPIGAPATSDAPRESSAARALRTTEAPDARMLSRVERTLGADPPAVFHQLVVERRDGASRDALEAHIRRELGEDLRLLHIAMDWLDEIAPAPGAVPAPTDPSELGFGEGGNPRRVQPLVPRASEEVTTMR